MPTPEASALARKRLDDARNGATDKHPDKALHEQSVARLTDQAIRIAKVLDDVDTGSKKGEREEASALSKARDLVIAHQQLEEVQRVSDPLVRTAFLLIVNANPDLQNALQAADETVKDVKEHHRIGINGPLLRQLLTDFYRPPAQAQKQAVDRHNAYVSEQGEPSIGITSPGR